MGTNDLEHNFLPQNVSCTCKIDNNPVSLEMMDRPESVFAMRVIGGSTSNSVAESGWMAFGGHPDYSVPNCGSSDLGRDDYLSYLPDDIAAHKRTASRFPTLNDRSGNSYKSSKQAHWFLGIWKFEHVSGAAPNVFRIANFARQVFGCESTSTNYLFGSRGGSGGPVSFGHDNQWKNAQWELVINTVQHDYIDAKIKSMAYPDSWIAVLKGNATPWLTSSNNASLFRIQRQRVGFPTSKPGDKLTYQTVDSQLPPTNMQISNLQVTRFTDKSGWGAQALNLVTELGTCMMTGSTGWHFSRQSADAQVKTDWDYYKTFGPLLDACTFACQQAPALEMGASWVQLNQKINGQRDCRIYAYDKRYRINNKLQRKEQNKWKPEIRNWPNQNLAFVNIGYDTNRFSNLTTATLRNMIVGSHTGGHALEWGFKTPATSNNDIMLGYNQMMGVACNRMDTFGSSCIFHEEPGKCRVSMSMNYSGVGKTCRNWMFNEMEPTKSAATTYSWKIMNHTLIDVVNKFCLVNVPADEANGGNMPLYLSKGFAAYRNENEGLGQTINDNCLRYYGGAGKYIPGTQSLPTWGGIGSSNKPLFDAMFSAVFDSQNAYCAKFPNSNACKCIDASKPDRPWSDMFALYKSAFGQLDSNNSIPTPRDGVKLTLREFWPACRNVEQPSEGTNAFVEPRTDAWVIRSISFCAQVVILSAEVNITNNVIAQKMDCKLKTPSGGGGGNGGNGGNGNGGNGNGGNGGNGGDSTTQPDKKTEETEFIDYIKENITWIIAVLVGVVLVLVVVVVLVKRRRRLALGATA
jgi:hypothetical protein